MVNENANQAADEAENPQTPVETADEQQEAAPETDNDPEVTGAEADEPDSADEGADQHDQTPRETGLCEQAADEAFKVRAVQGKQEECFALHRLEAVLGQLKASIPSAVEALGDDDSDLKTTLDSLLSVL